MSLVLSSASYVFVVFTPSRVFFIPSGMFPFVIYVRYLFIYAVLSFGLCLFL